MARVNKTHVVKDPSDNELNDREDVESMGAEAGGGESMPPPSYAELSFFFGRLEHFAPSCGNDEVENLNLLHKTRMSFIRGIAFKPARQADMSEFV